MEKLPLAGFILVVVAFVLNLALTFPLMWWYKHKVTSGSNSGTFYLGLWRECTRIDISGSTTDTCYRHTEDNFSQDKKYIGAAQSYQSSAFALLFIAIVITAMKLFVAKFKCNPALFPVAAMHALWGAMYLIASGGAFGRGIHDSTTLETSNLNLSFYFTFINGVFGLIGGILLIVAAFKGNSKAAPLDTADDK